MWQVPELPSTLDVRVDGDTVIVLRRHNYPACPHYGCQGKFRLVQNRVERCQFLTQWFIYLPCYPAESGLTMV